MANKYSYLWIVQGNYGFGHGWEDVAASEKFREARDDLRSHQTNEPGYPFRMIQRRELNHTLKVISLHDAQAECSCGWMYGFTGELSNEQIVVEWEKHLTR